ncbi:MAG: hypothetical protein HW391_1463 [Chloroflexi bacterium]|nr:hypothetical protein [Chloroflexota bacterium]
MFRATRRTILLSLGLGLVLIAPTAVSATHSWGPPYHWARTANPFTLKLGDNLSSTWDPILVTSRNDWNVSTVLETAIVDGSSSRPKQCRAKAGTIQVCNATYGNNGWLGVASISITGGTHITQATVKVNDTYFNNPPYDTTPWRNMVMCQEVGHAFGLDHQDVTFGNANLGSCMDYTNDPSTNQHPNQHDYDWLEVIYGHTDSTTTIAAAPAAAPAAAAGGTADSSWGDLVAVTNGGHGATFVLDLGYGLRTVTYVLWADR